MHIGREGLILAAEGFNAIAKINNLLYGEAFRVGGSYFVLLPTLE